MCAWEWNVLSTTPQGWPHHHRGGGGVVGERSVICPNHLEIKMRALQLKKKKIPINISIRILLLTFGKNYKEAQDIDFAHTWKYSPHKIPTENDPNLALSHELTLPSHYQRMKWGFFFCNNHCYLFFCFFFFCEVHGAKQYGITFLTSSRCEISGSLVIAGSL